MFKIYNSCRIKIKTYLGRFDLCLQVNLSATQRERQKFSKNLTTING